MPKNQKREPAVEYINLGLTEDLNKRLNAYCLKKMQKVGKISHGIRTKVIRKALKEWLDNHENDITQEL